MERKLIKKSDLLIIFILLSVMVIAFTALRSRPAGGMAVVSLTGEKVLSLPLEDDIIINLRELNGSYPDMILEVENKSIQVKNAACPDKICMRTGKIHNSLQSVVCLPNKIVITIEDSEKSNIDAVI